MSLAVVEKRPPANRPGGCAGVLFHLWDWNRRLAKRKLFPRRLLPPLRSPKKGRDDKMPKPPKPPPPPPPPPPVAELLPAAAVDGMREPGLVARLMGLDSLPAPSREKSRKAFDSQILLSTDSSRSSSCDTSRRRLDQDLCLEIDGGPRKAEPSSPPLKLQKTGGFLERQPVDVADMLNKCVMLSRSRRRELKLEPTMRSPRSPSGGRRARLAQAAARILEPGMRPGNRDKRALTFRCSSSHENAEQSCDPKLSSMKLHEFIADSLVDSFKSCGSLVDDSGPGSMDKEAQVVDDESSEGVSERAIPREPEKSTSLLLYPTINVDRRTPEFSERKNNSQVATEQCKVAPTRPSPKRDGLKEIRKPVIKSKIIQGSEFSREKPGKRSLIESRGSKDFISPIKYESNRAKMKFGTSGDRIEPERINQGKKVPCKRRTLCSPQVESAISEACSTSRKQSVNGGINNRRGTAPTSNGFINGACSKRNFRKKENVVNSSDKMVQKNKDEVGRRIDACPMRGLSRDSKCRTISSPSLIAGDKLSKILEEKIRELNSLDGNELAITNPPYRRSSASILLELISALTKETGPAPTSSMQGSHEEFPANTNLPNQPPQFCKQYQGESNVGFSAVNQINNDDQPSPISTLEACFSNDSCSLGSPDDKAGGKPLFGIEHSNTRGLPALDSDSFDSATSVSTAKTNSQTISCVANRNPSLQHLGSLDLGVFGATLASSNAENLFANVLLCNSDKVSEFSVHSFLLNLMEAVEDALCTGPGERRSCRLSNNHLFDCMLECLDSKYGNLHKCGYKCWLKSPVVPSRGQLAKEIGKEILAWSGMAGKFLDALVRKDLGCSTTESSGHGNAISEIGMDIESGIIQALLDEFVCELW